MTIISTATPSATPSTEINVITETNVLLGRRYRSASSSSNGKRDMRRKARRGRGACQRGPPRGAYPDQAWSPGFSRQDLRIGSGPAKFSRQRVIEPFLQLKPGLHATRN